MTTPAAVALRIRKAILGPTKRAVQTRVFWVSRRIVLAVDTTRQWEPMAATVPVSFRVGHKADLDCLDEPNHGYDLAALDFGRRRIEAGDTLTLASRGNAVVFYAWLMYGQMDLDAGLPVSASSDKAYSYRVFAHAAYRGLRICPAYYDRVRRVLRDKGYRTLFCQVDASNAPSLKAHQRSGFVRVGAFWVIQIAGKRHYVVGRRIKSWLATPHSSHSPSPDESEHLLSR